MDTSNLQKSGLARKIAKHVFSVLTLLARKQISARTLKLNLIKKVELQLKNKIKKTHVKCFYFDQKFCHKRIVDRKP